MRCHEPLVSKKRAVLAFTFMSSVLICPIGHAETWESQPAVLQAAQSVLPRAQGDHYRGNPPTTAGWVRACPQPLKAQISSQSQWALTVRVSCEAPTSRWSLYVPFERSYTSTIVIARNFLAPGTVIQSNSVEVRRERIDAETGSVCTSIHQVIGDTVNAGIAKGMPIRPENLLAPLIIRQGERVMLKARQHGVVASAMGIAMENGRAGASILVRNTTSHKLLTGVVSANGTVWVSPWRSHAS
ncbi:flagellar basal body P-ring formation chaperone FlgA [Acidithiobacillus caldus]|uniref:flagellar basal body P-ring formation chaperone FlgA n=2 Tax=Acidithiobacillus caldus TaxID=33059 RepID=UPI0003001AF0|nr:flagellar basal body P-ring formation chaperone FlgA [Acidithiobacillus caldus]MBU2729640.1 flagellar basal body P-ring formation protein FlgA [Acidithiobacillus caldus]MBU2734219.1 flagellar basal body P-ring formation protein FlgA [Acidithiobacillus caldus ATCC 51756]MBU2746065.1 flagellar basal body P-ring formation protein FlgA [Acidithiobacillus caldus]MBU2779680.1 flagellar basal body P-ring formation protein FlgA [Acidithiobacillus caldus]